MRVFLTGATGFIGSRIVPELIAAGHQVIGLARSDSSAQVLLAAGAEVHRGILEDPNTLREGVAKADAVIHTAFDHDFSNFAANCEKDRRVIEALGAALKGSSRPLIITSGTGIGDAGDGQPAREDFFDANYPNPRIATEQAGNALLEDGLDVRFIRLPQVHDTIRQGLISSYIEISRQKGSVAFIGEGANLWPAAHVKDVAKLYVLVLEKGDKGKRYHAVAEEGVSARDIAQVVSNGLGLPQISLPQEASSDYFGWFALFADKNHHASGAWTRENMGWNPVGPGLIEDLQGMDYSHLTSADRN